MKKIKSIYMILAVVMCMTACDDSILDVENPNSYTSATFFNTEVELLQGTNAIYSGLYFGGLWAREYYFIFDLLGNDAQVATALQGELAEFAKYTFKVNHGQITAYWRSLYRLVLRSNLVIEKGQDFLEANGPNENVSRFIGEARFLRAYAYFELASQFGRVPMKLSLEDVEVVQTPRVENVTEVWEVVANDLILASEVLPDSYPATDLGRATKGAAIALLGKTYLYQEKYFQAATEFAKIYSKYTLLPGANWNDNFTDEDALENNSESVFEVQLKHIPGANTWYMFGGQEDWGQGAAHSGRPMEYGFNDWQNVFISDAAVAQFNYKDENNEDYIDPRAAKTFYGANGLGDDRWCDNCNLTIADVPDGDPVEWANGKTPLIYNFAVRGYRFKKYQNYEKRFKEGLPESSNNGKLIRFADVLLMYAEAQIQSGNVVEGISLINEVRTRVGAFPYSGAYDQSSAMELLKRERHLELCGEQTRFRDLVRWGDAKTILNQELSEQYGAGQYFFDKHELFPIPLAERETNPAVASDIANDWN
ncbi:RagB/SusD family nutrient uptake outer membrane protein [Algoriphagus aestuarii]|nr:RagB/SusD family nutrient uptake outer membrane protein [Algoriphagus aestuarii]